MVALPGMAKLRSVPILLIATAVSILILIPQTYSEDSSSSSGVCYENAQSAKLATAKNWIDAVIAEHNYYRGIHGACPLTFNKKLSEIAQNWAWHLAHEDRLDPSNTECLGENLAKQWSTEPWKIDSFFAPEKWYDDEIDNYNITTGEAINGRDIGNVTQMLWKATREVGIAYASYKKGEWTKYVVVAEYYPAANRTGPAAYLENVLPPSSSLPAECNSTCPMKPDSVYGELNKGTTAFRPSFALVAWSCLSFIIFEIAWNGRAL